MSKKSLSRTQNIATHYDSHIPADRSDVDINYRDFYRKEFEVPTIAIIIDDFGPYLDRDLINGFIQLPYDITLSIIPGYDRTVRTALDAEYAGKDVFIHLPMEPIDSVAMDETIMVNSGTRPEELTLLMKQITEHLPMAVGLNNHMGSLATQDYNLMSSLAENLKLYNLVFVDSYTVQQSRGLQAMRDNGVESLGRDVFLDFHEDQKEIEQQLDKLREIAEIRGYAVGIGHVKWETLAVLRKKLAEWKKQEIRLVNARELVLKVNVIENGYAIP